MHASRLLIVEDHPILADALRMNLLQLLPRVQCLLAYDLAQGLEMLLEHSPIDLVVLDLNLPDSQGISIYRLVLMCNCGCAGTGATGSYNRWNMSSG